MIMKSQEEYRTLWLEVNFKLQQLAKLDPPQDRLDIYKLPDRHIFGASTHQYKTSPLSEKHILSVEEHNKITFPENFRTYLSIIGLPSAGPYYGVNFRPAYSNNKSYGLADPGKLAIPSSLKSRKGIGYTKQENEEDQIDTDDEYQFNFDTVENGWIEIGTSGNPCCYYLIINGECRGHVFWWTVDMLGHSGLFEDWYIKWLDATCAELKSKAITHKKN